MKIYDNSNLAESYSGITTPLTFSFARHVYQEVYKNFCQMMGVNKKIIDANADMFPEMVVYIGGRMYYYLTNWYRMISFLPGYSFNKGFFEKMLGVNKETDFEKERPKSFIKKWFFYFPKTLLQIIKILFSFAFMSVLVKRFSSNFDSVYNAYNKKDLSKEDENSLKNIFNRLTSKLVVQWKVPIANDFAVMVSTGVVHKLFNKWLPDQDSYKYLYVGSSSPLISLDPGMAIVDIIRMIRNDKEHHILFNLNKDPKDILNTLENQYKNHEISKKIFDYIKKYGDRMPGELKLESKSLGECPEIFIKIIANAIKNNKSNVRRNIQQISIDQFRISFIKKLTLSLFLKWAKKSIELREETRFKRTLIFGFARKVFTELGKKYTKRNIINDQDDIFYLTLEEVLGDLQSSSEQLKLKIQKRKEYLTLWKMIELPRRIETDLKIIDYEKSYLGQKESRKDKDEAITGMVVSMGGLNELYGESLVMREFDPSADFNNKIIVTSHTDPGWSLVFPFIKGLVVERGGMLSHAAIIARELNIPCIVGVESATDMIINGESIELNLESGEIIKK